MLFNSQSFLIFFPTVTALYFLLPYTWRWALLLMASCLFYMWFIPKYILILAITILIDYAAGILIENAEGGRKKKYLIISIISTCAVLFSFKYLDFFNTNVTALAHFLGWNYSLKALHLILPIGLSFHTFQSLAYVIEVYRGRQKAERDFGIYALYVMFYPQLVAGPIERPQNLLHQFYEKHQFNCKRVSQGLKLMAWGFFKKVVIADRLVDLVNAVYDHPTGQNGLALFLGTLFFTFQIYCDFSGYTDIARGAAQVMGFRLMVNFRQPYFSESISEFWKRWHISLSTWFKDYVYVELGGNRCSKPRLYFNLMFTFALSGLWHGANWTYLAWGALNGFYLVFALCSARLRGGFLNLLGLSPTSTVVQLSNQLITFFLIFFSWIFFRAKTMSDATYISTHIFSNWSRSGISTMDYGSILKALLLIGILVLVDAVLVAPPDWSVKLYQRSYVRWSFYYATVLGIILFGVNSDTQFIYFQF